MGAGQIGGLATLLDIDFNNAAGFIGVNSAASEATYVVYFLSHTMLFCMGSLIEAHVVLTAAVCVYGEKFRFDVFGGTHMFLETAGISRKAEHMAVHRGYNHTLHWTACSPDNIALLLLQKQFHLHEREPGTEFVMNRLRYGVLSTQSPVANTNCKFYGWGSRRNGYLVPLLLKLRRVDVTILPCNQCPQMWNSGGKYLCLRQFRCKSEAHGALCPDDVGSVVECSGFLRGMMSSRLIDRPCGVGFLDMSKYLKFITCGVDDARDILGHNDFMEFEFDHTTPRGSKMKNLHTVANESFVTLEADLNVDDGDPGPPTLPSTLSGEEPEMDPEIVVPALGKDEVQKQEHKAEAHQDQDQNQAQNQAQPPPEPEHQKPVEAQDQEFPADGTL
ncbi:hypothetical protein O0L34_g472 [Tuta absoluta]|nr:hypothetical protein O0L34_g472 [Tuta absoluta]